MAKKIQNQNAVPKKVRVLPTDSYIELQLQHLGEKIRKLRKDAGYTNADFFAYDNTISRSQYSRYERGEDMRFSSLLKLLEIHKVSIKDFFSDGFE